jgi:hypothetical protein
VPDGTDILESKSGCYYLNGVPGAELPTSFRFASRIRSPPTSSMSLKYLGDASVSLKTYKDFVSVLIEQARARTLVTASASWATSDRDACCSRDGNTVLEDPMLWARSGRSSRLNSLFQTLLFPSASDGVHEASPPMQAKSGPSPLGDVANR